MTKLAWDSSFRRAFMRRTRKNPALEDRILQVLEHLATGEDLIVLIDLGSHDEMY